MAQVVILAVVAAMLSPIVWTEVKSAFFARDKSTSINYVEHQNFSKSAT
jgi:hypothetical protein